MLRKSSTTEIRKVGYHIQGNHQETKKLNLKEQEIVEWIKCRNNPLYYIYNYIHFRTIGGVSSYKEQTDGHPNFHKNFRNLIRIIYRHHLAQLMASRQLGKSTISAAIISWATNFFPGNNSIILNLQKHAALKNLETIRFMNDQLPLFLQNGLKSKSDIKTYADFSNGSKVAVYYPTTVHSKSTIARSLTAPILYVDESAHIPDMKEIFGSAQPILSKAREQASKNKYPYMILTTTTPNGVSGTGEWFYDRWQNGIDSDILFDPETNEWVSNADELLSDASKNGFVKIEYHWSEDPTKDENWYIQQCRELTDKRLINQELDLKFVGSTNCIFDDEVLNEFKHSKPLQIIKSPNETHFTVFNTNLNKNDYYLIGVDTARSLTGAYNSIEIFSFYEFNQIAEFNYRLGSFTKYGEIIDFIFKWLYQQVGSNIILAIENNTIGLAPIEYLLNHTKGINYHQFIYKEKKAKEYGISTTGVSKDMIIGCFTEIVKENPESIKSKDLINQISSIERTRGGSIGSTTFSDLFMAASFCAYARKMKSIEILPQIKMGIENYQTQLVDTFQSLFKQNQNSHFINNQTANITSMEDENEIDKLIAFQTKLDQNKEIDIVELISPF